ncbi:MAG TPA: gfo/Idh/MocA family oxidoreductase [Phycisphaerales bacterium]|nr:gfo/Idh/MocA family oxidoreductase [Phycisphaerales bacterium]
MSIDRRTFLKGSLVSSLALGIPALSAANRTRTYRTALIGSGWWGMNIAREAMACGRCKMVALCDVDERQLNPAAEQVEKLSGDKPNRYKDFRELLDKEKPDIAIVATPDHWHPLITIAAVRAGAHVYVEKPIGHTIGEGRAMVKAARDTGKVVQVGTHRRVSPHNVSGRKFILDGNAGKIGMVRCFVHYGGGPETPRKNIEPPKGLDWDMWCGPGPLRPFNGSVEEPWGGGIHPRGFRQYLDYANGTLGDWGIHWTDQVLWVMEEKWPRTIYSCGGRAIKGPPILTDELQTTDAPDHLVTTWQFEDFTCVWEHRQFAGNNTDKGENVGCYFYGTQGIFHMGWKGGWTFYPAGAGQTIHEEPKLNQPDDQNIKELWADLLNAIETGAEPVCDIEKVHHSTNMSLLGMLALKVNRSIAWDGETETIRNDPEANKLLRRQYRAPWVYPQA